MVRPAIAFPSKGPTTPTGPGAIAWASAPAPCRSGSRRSHRWALAIAAVGPADRARSASTQPPEPGASVGLTAVGASYGRVALLATNVTHTSADGASVVLQGNATHPRDWLRSMVGSRPPTALARAYLGDAAFAIVAPAVIEVRVERNFQHDFGRARSIPIGAGRVTSLTVALDYRADALVAWQQDGAIYASTLHASGHNDPTQRVGPSDPGPQLQAVLSDNGHGMIAWSSTEARERVTPMTRLYLSLSAVGPRFKAPRMLAVFADPQQVGHRPGSLALERLSTENVMLAWTAAEHGHYLVRAAPAVFAASRPTTLLSGPHTQAILADLAPGPARETIALWSSAPQLASGALDMRHVELWTARLSFRPHDRVVSTRPEMIAAAGPNAAPAVAVDPASDRAIAAWLTLTSPRRIEYAVSVGAVGYHPHTPVATNVPMGGGTHWLRIVLAVTAAMILVATARSLRRRRRNA
jgi:hypothetical protein